MSVLFHLSVASFIIFFRLSNIVFSQESGPSYFFYQQPEYPRDCKEVRDSCHTQISSGVFLIKPDGYHKPFEVYCDNDAESNGWTVIQRRLDGSVTFQRDWLENKAGFGFVSQKFWLGNEKLSFLTNQNTYELRIDFTYSDGSSVYAVYNLCRISDEFSGYTLTRLGLFSGTANFTTCPNNKKYLSCTCEKFCGNPDVCLVFQRRVDGSVDFHVYWDDYKNGFGSPDHELWMGNEKLYSLTNQKRYQLRIDIVNRLGAPYYAKYDFFRINNEANNYRLTIGAYSGDAGDSLTRCDNAGFSTRDRDNDDVSWRHVAGDSNYGAWWYGDYYSLLNANYYGYFGVNWDAIPGGSTYFIKFTEMKVRPV